MKKVQKIEQVRKMINGPEAEVLTAQELKFMKAHNYDAGDCHAILIRHNSKALKLAESIVKKLASMLIRVKVLPRAVIRDEARERQGQRTDLTLDNKLSEVNNGHATKTASIAANLFNTNRTYINEAQKLKDERPEEEPDPEETYKMSFPDVWSDIWDEEEEEDSKDFLIKFR